MLFRYPGGKSKVSNFICDKIKQMYLLGNCAGYAEPFLGSGAIAFNLIKDQLLWNVRLNDADKGICSIWNTIYREPWNLIETIENYIPNVENFFNFKSQLLDNEYLNTANESEIAFKKIAVHQMSFSGLGTKAGSPIGGKNQVNVDGSSKKYCINCRWSPKKIKKDIELIHEYLNQVDFYEVLCTDYDYKIVLNEVPSNWFFYLDPPYYEMGNELYQNAFTEEDHIELAEILKTKKHWVLSYDNHPVIKELYNWAKIEEIPIKYTIMNKTEECKELVISL